MTYSSQGCLCLVEKAIHEENLQVKIGFLGLHVPCIGQDCLSSSPATAAGHVKLYHSASCKHDQVSLVGYSQFANNSCSIMLHLHDEWLLRADFQHA